jgi:hypothetical protein
MYLTLSKGEPLCSIHLAHLLVLVFAGLWALLLFEDAFTVFVKLEWGDDTVTGMNWNLNWLFVLLIPGDFLNVNASASAVNSHDFSFTRFEVTSQNFDLITFADWDWTHVVFVFKVFGKMAWHHDSTNTAGSSEVCLSWFSTLARYTYNYIDVRLLMVSYSGGSSSYILVINNRDIPFP